MARVQRIASLLSSATEMLYRLGLGNRIVAVGHECDFPPDARVKPKATRSFIDSACSSQEIDDRVRELTSTGASLYGIDTELLCELQPDLIVTQAQCDVCAVRYADVVDLVRSRGELQHTQVFVLNPASLDDILADILRLANATDTPTAGREVVHSLRGRIDTIRHRVEGFAENQRQRVVCIEWVEPLMAAGNWTPELIEIAGGSSGLAHAGKHSEYCTWADIAAYNPDVLLCAPCGFDLSRSLQEATRLPHLPGWNDLAAVKSDQVYAIDGNAYLNRSGPRMIDSLEILAHLIHPELFTDPGYEHAWTRCPSESSSSSQPQKKQVTLPAR